MIVYCPCAECKYNRYRRCKAPGITLSAHYVTTLWDGHQNFWKCKNYELSEEAERINTEAISIFEKHRWPE